MGWERGSECVCVSERVHLCIIYLNVHTRAHTHTHSARPQPRPSAAPPLRVPPTSFHWGSPRSVTKDLQRDRPRLGLWVQETSRCDLLGMGIRMRDVPPPASSSFRTRAQATAPLPFSESSLPGDPPPPSHLRRGQQQHRQDSALPGHHRDASADERTTAVTLPSVATRRPPGPIR